MATTNRDWIARQFAKGISAEESVIRAERDHHDKLKEQNLKDLYSEIIRDDERHLDDLKKIAAKYGHKEGGMMEGAGGLLGSVKSAVESVASTDPFQTIGDDLMLKSNAANYDRTWKSVFQAIGDNDSADMMSKAAEQDEIHRQRMLDALATIGISEAQGHEFEEKRAA